MPLPTMPLAPPTTQRRPARRLRLGALPLASALEGPLATDATCASNWSKGTLRGCREGGGKTVWGVVQGCRGSDRLERAMAAPPYAAELRTAAMSY